MTKKLIYLAVPAALLIIISLIVKFSWKINYESKDYTWNTEVGGKDGDFLIRGKKIDKIKKDINKLISAINKSDKDPEIFRTPSDKEPTDPPKLKLIDIKGQIINVDVINDEYLTQRMGSTGAEEFLAMATFTLTEHDNIKFINFIFEEGDHARPGLYSREKFLKNWKIKG